MENSYKNNRRRARQIAALMTDDRLPEEEVCEWLNRPEGRHTAELFADADSLERALDAFDREEKTGSARRLRQRIESKRRTRRVARIAVASTAAAAVLVVAAMIFVPRTVSDKNIEFSVLSESYDAGSQVPVVVLASGGAVWLDSVSRDNIFHADELEMPADETAEGRMNTVIIPYGCTYTVELPDGTRVWLNACSRLSYDSRMGRHVELQGEGYFEVEHAKSPFDVVCGDVTVRVYGTRFNVKTFGERERVQTVLVEGSVGIRYGNAGDEVMLSPGERAETSDDGRTTIRPVDTYRYTAWMQGVFIFENAALEEILAELAKWYNVDFRFADKEMAGERIMASFSRELPLDEILSMLGTISRVQFKTEGRTIYVE